MATRTLNVSAGDGFINPAELRVSVTDPQGNGDEAIVPVLLRVAVSLRSWQNFPLLAWSAWKKPPASI